MAVSAIIGTGATLTVGGSSWTYPILSINGLSISRISIEASKMATSGWHDFLAGNLKDPGEITAECEWDGELPTFSTSAVAIVLTASNSQAVTGTGFLTNFDVSVPLEDKCTCTCTFKLTGSLTST